jgi:SAM-dependent methyltransferase
MGRWSRVVAVRFVEMLDRPSGLRWLDVGCGTGALSEAILDSGAPQSVVGIDPAEAFVDLGRKRLGARAELHVGSGDRIPFEDGEFDVVVSGLALNFMPDTGAALAEWRRLVKPGGSIGAYVWDYAERMGFLRAFWDAAAAVDPASAGLDQAERFKICDPDALRAAFDGAGLSHIQTGSLEITTRFADLEDFWQPFLSGQGPAGGYVATLDQSHRDLLRTQLEVSLPRTGDGSIELPARAWTVIGFVD